MEEIKAIVFDWDGTIVDTMSLKINNAGALFANKFGVEPNSVEESYKRYSGVARRELFELIAQENIGRNLTELEFHHLSAEFTMRNVASYQNNKVFNDRTRSFLDEMKASGRKLFVSSSAIQEEVMGLAELLNIRIYFTEILGSKKGFRKGKEHIDYIRDKYGLTAGDLLFVGDEKSDIRLSGRLGLRSIGVAHNKAHSELEAEFADHVVDNVVEIGGFLAVA